MKNLFCLMKIAMLLTLLFHNSYIYATIPKKIITVPIGFMDSFDASDSTDFNIYKESLESTINYALGENGTKLANCGYELLPSKVYFSASDLLSAKNKAAQLESEGIWIIQGPQYSDAFVMVSKGLKNTALISPMASSEAAFDLKPPFFTMSESSDSLAKYGAIEAKKENLGSNYGTFINATCSACISYEKSFDKYAAILGLQKKFNLDFSNETPDLEKLVLYIKKNKIDFLLLPNYSKSVGYTIFKLQKQFPHLKYLGFAGWGQGFWSFLPTYHIPNSVVAISIRQSLSAEKTKHYLGVYSLDRKWNNSIIPPSQLDYFTIEFIRKLTHDLCQNKPKNKADFLQYIRSQSTSHYRTIIPICTYRFKDGAIIFDHITARKNKEGVINAR